MKFTTILAIIAPVAIADLIQSPTVEKDVGSVVASPSGDNGIKLNFDQGLTSGNFEVANYGTISISNSSIVSNTRVNQTINVVVNGNIVNAPIVNSPGAKQSILINNVPNVKIPAGDMPVIHKPFNAGAQFNATIPIRPASGNGTVYHPKLPISGAKGPTNLNSGSLPTKGSVPIPTSAAAARVGSASGSTLGSTSGSTPGSAAGSTPGSAAGSTVNSGSAASGGAAVTAGSRALPDFTGAAAKTSESKILLTTIFAIGAYWM